MIALEVGKLAAHRQFAITTEQREHGQVGRDVTLDPLAQHRFESQRLGELVVDRPALRVVQRGLVGRAFVGEHHPVETLHQRQKDQHTSIDGGDRHMPVPGAKTVKLGQLRVDMPFDDQVVRIRRTGHLANQRCLSDLNRGKLPAPATQSLQRHE
ncbi:hypothetical protein DZK26_00125 [Wenzhouxiangella sp. 15190]|nr:hypothetical protein DZK26_00125 [Wenzhouxiangella sp. 15190]